LLTAALDRAYAKESSGVGESRSTGEWNANPASKPGRPKPKRAKKEAKPKRGRKKLKNRRIDEFEKRNTVPRWVREGDVTPRGLSLW